MTKSVANQQIKTYHIEKEAELLQYMLDNFPSKKRPVLKAVLAGGQIRVNNVLTTQYNHPLKKGDQLSINWSKPTKKVKLSKLNILFEDKDIIVIEKEAGLLSVASAKEKSKTAIQILKEHVEAQNPQDRVFIVHRLEREMSGILLFAKSKEVQSLLQENWNEHVLERTYIAVVEGKIKEKEATLKNYLTANKNNRVFISKSPQNATLAITKFKLLKQSNAYSMLELTTESGFKNQIRVQLDHYGYPVTGDKKYNAKKNPLGRIALHANLLTIKHPVSHKALKFELVAPPKFRSLVATNN